MNQVKRDSQILEGAVDLAPFVERLCSMSYVRYFLEAVLLWDPDIKDITGR